MTWELTTPHLTVAYTSVDNRLLQCSMQQTIEAQTSLVVEIYPGFKVQKFHVNKLKTFRMRWGLVGGIHRHIVDASHE